MFDRSYRMYAEKISTATAETVTDSAGIWKKMLASEATITRISPMNSPICHIRPVTEHFRGRQGAMATSPAINRRTWSSPVTCEKWRGITVSRSELAT